MRNRIAVTTSLLLASGMAMAGDMSDKPSFSELDKDGNGAISRTEAFNNDALMATFTEADSDRNGQLSKTEFSAVEAELEEAE